MIFFPPHFPEKLRNSSVFPKAQIQVLVTPASISNGNRKWQECTVRAHPANKSTPSRWSLLVGFPSSCFLPLLPAPQNAHSTLCSASLLFLPPSTSVPTRGTATVHQGLWDVVLLSHAEGCHVLLLVMHSFSIA